MSTEPAGHGTGQGASRPFWLGDGAAACFAWLYLPVDSKRSGLGVLLCPSLGHEYVHAHRSMRHLAERLQASGHTVVRMDAPGSGDSAGVPADLGSASAWHAAVASMLEYVASQPGISHTVLFGVRLAGLLAAEFVTRQPVDFLALWSPVTRGGAWVRELRALARFALRPPRDEDPAIEAGGFPFAPGLLADVSASRLRETRPQAGRILLMHDPAVEGAGAEISAWMEAGIACDTRPAPGLADMLAEPQSTRVPEEAIATLTEWLDSQPLLPLAPVMPRRHQVRDVLELEGVRERLLRDEGVPFSIETEPADPARAGMPVLLLCNSGSVHHVGPNRVYVELARRLAAAGFTVVRFDLANLGDSAQGSLVGENHPYPPTAPEQALAVARAARARHPGRPVVVAGLCSGAHAAFHAGLQDREGLLAGVLMINPLTFYWHPGLSLDIPQAHRNARDAKYYERAVLNRSSWRKLLSGRSDYGYILRFVGGFIANRLRGVLRWALEAGGIVPPSRLAQDLQRLVAGKHVSVVLSDTDPGLAILRADGGLAVRRMLRRGRLGMELIPEADHTFSQRHARERLVEACLRLGSIESL